MKNASEVFRFECDILRGNWSGFGGFCGRLVESWYRVDGTAWS